MPIFKLSPFFKLSPSYYEYDGDNIALKTQQQAIATFASFWERRQA